MKIEHKFYIIFIITLIIGITFVTLGSKQIPVYLFDEADEYLVHSSNTTFIDYNFYNCTPVTNTDIITNITMCNNISVNLVNNNLLPNLCFSLGSCLQTINVCNTTVLYNVHCNCFGIGSVCSSTHLCQDFLDVKCSHFCANYDFFGRCTDHVYTCPSSQIDLVDSCKKTCGNKVDTIYRQDNCHLECANQDPNKLCNIHYFNNTLFELQFAFNANSIQVLSNKLSKSCLPNDLSCISSLFQNKKIYYYIDNPSIYQYSPIDQIYKYKSEGLLFTGISLLVIFGFALVIYVIVNFNLKVSI